MTITSAAADGTTGTRDDRLSGVPSAASSATPVRPPTSAQGASESSPSDPTALAIAQQVGQTLARRGVETTEWWTTLLAAALSSVLALIGVPGSSATQIVAIAAPVVLAVVYAVARGHHKSQLASVFAALFPQSDQPV